MAAAALAVLAEASLQQLEVLFRRSTGATLQAIATAFATSTSKVDYQIRTVARITDAHSSNDAPAAKILEKVLDLLSIGTDDK